MKRKTNPFWEFFGYVTLTGLIVAQVTIGYWYLFAQGLYLFCNVINLIRDFAEHMPTSYKVKDSCFTAITIGLIIIWIIK